jgi:HNH/ENDO VII superfamily nuclease with conserved GHE residues
VYISPLPATSSIRAAANSLRDEERILRIQSTNHDSFERTIGPGTWQGQTASVIKPMEGTLAGQCMSAANAIGKAAGALEDLASYLSSIEYRHSQLAAQARNIDAANTQKHGHTLALLEANKPLSDLKALENQIRSRISHAADLVNDAAHHSRDYKTNVNFNRGAAVVSFIEGFGHETKEFAKGAIEGVVDPIKGTVQLITNPGELVDLGRALQKDPGGTLNKIWDGIIDLDTWKSNPSEAMGKLLPTVVLTIITAGGGGAAKGAEGAGAISKSAKVMGETEKAAEKLRTIPKTYDRPSHFPKGFRNDVWNSAANKQSNVIDPLSHARMDPSQPWDMGHAPGFEFRKHQLSAADRGISRQEFLDEYFNLKHFRPELPSSNRSHAGEDSSDTYFGP